METIGSMVIDIQGWGENVDEGNGGGNREHVHPVSLAAAAVHVVPFCRTRLGVARAGL